MTPHPTDRDWDRLDALVDEDPIALRDAAWRLTTALAAEEAELDSWMTRAYEAEGKLWKAEARIKAMEDVLDRKLPPSARTLAAEVRRALGGA